MLARVRHRGPDGAGTFVGGAVALGHARLSIIDLSDAAAQPMHDPGLGNVITFNGEIYNYADVAKELGPGPPGMSNGDTATLLRAYGTWGAAALDRLRGMFAFAVWDVRKRKVFLARDRFGMKPLYYRRIRNCLLFASEIRPLLIEDFPHSANERMVASFLAYRHLDATPQTCFQEIQQLPAAHYAWVGLDGAMSNPERYWSPPRFGGRTFTAGDSDEVRNAVTDSVVSHLRSDVPIGAFVSGGIDSSAIACTAASLMSTGKLSTYSSVLCEAHTNSENQLIPAVLRQIQSKSHTLAIDGKQFVDDLPAVFDCHEEPLADASMYAHWRLCKLSRETGIRVLLSGNGGDEVFGGYRGHLNGCLGSLIGRGRLAGAVAMAREFASMGLGSFGGLMSRGLHESLPRFAKRMIKRQHARRWLAGSVFEPLASGIRFYHTTEADPLEAVFRENLEHWCVPPFLHYEDRNGMAFGVEIRTPLLDHELLSVVWQFDAVSLLRGRSKHALRAAMRGTVPDEVLEQPGKFGFAAPLDLYLHADKKKFRDIYHDVVSACPYFDAAVASRLLDGFYAGHTMVVRPWRVFSVALWYDRFIRRFPEVEAARVPAVRPVVTS
jgi:asparagine synthase (glutamine-hydrolysing)